MSTSSDDSFDYVLDLSDVSDSEEDCPESALPEDTERALMVNEVMKALMMNPSMLMNIAEREQAAQAEEPVKPIKAEQQVKAEEAVQTATPAEIMTILKVEKQCKSHAADQIMKAIRAAELARKEQSTEAQQPAETPVQTMGPTKPAEDKKPVEPENPLPARQSAKTVPKMEKPAKDPRAEYIYLSLLYAIFFGCLLVIVGCALAYVLPQMYNTQAPVVKHQRTMYDHLFGSQKYNDAAYHKTKWEHIQKGQLEMKTIEEAEKIAEALEKFNSMSFKEKLEINKWVPLPESSEGLQEYMKETLMAGNIFEEFLHLASPHFKVHKCGTITMEFRHGSLKHVQNIRKSAPRQKDSAPQLPKLNPNGVRHGNSMKISSNARLTITDTSYKNDKRIVFTRVYYLPIADMLNLV